MSFQLVTERCFLREFSIDDAKHFLALNANPEVLKYTGDVPFQDLDEATNFVQNYNAYKKHNMGRWSVVLREENEWIGWCGLKYHPVENFVDLGFRFHQKHWNQGYATETAKACIKYGFKDLGLNQLIARAHPKNTASLRVIEKLGFSYVENIFDEKQNEIMQFRLTTL